MYVLCIFTSFTDHRVVGNYTILKFLSVTYTFHMVVLVFKRKFVILILFP